MVTRFMAVVCGVVLMSGTVPARAVEINTTFDRWMYPFNASPGVRVSGTTFGAIQNPAFDDLDAQILLGFDTASAGVPTGAGPGLYVITGARVELTTSTDGAIMLDNTYDPFASYLDESADTDAGRPVELYGVGFRNGYLGGGFGAAVPGPPAFEETESYGIPGPPAPERRHAYASDFAGGAARDVSNHIRNGFDTVPWAIGDVPGLAPGSPVPVDTAMLFELDLDNADLLAQLQSGLDQGGLFFVVGSKHRSVQGSNVGIPSFHLAADNGVSLGSVARLHLDYEVVPEPSSLALAALGLVCLPRLIRRRTK